MLQRILSAFGTTMAISLICIIRAKDPPSYSMDFLPETSFTCEGKSNGGFYADVETDCQLYHVCSRDKHGLMDDTMFLCGNGTVFDQRRLVCQDFRRVRCSNAPRYYRIPSHQPAEPKRPKIEDDVRIYEAPNYSMDFLPETSFTCQGKRHGHYYADVETDCQMYHVCSRNEDGLLESSKFLCANGTVFDQRKLVCIDYRRARCRSAPHFYRLAPITLGGPRTWRIMEEVLLTNRETPNYSMEYLPETSFTCQGKTNGGYYADTEAECQLYHVCSKNADNILQSTKFLCGNGTVFDQKKLVCDNFRKVRCQDSPRYYRNSATLLEELEKRRRSEEDDRKIFKDADVDLRRVD